MLGWAAVCVCFGALQPRHCSRMQPSLQPLLLWPGRSWKEEEGARSSIMPWQLLAKRRQKCKEMPGRCVRLCLGADECLREPHAMWLLEGLWANVGGHWCPLVLVPLKSRGSHLVKSALSAVEMLP